MPLALMELLLPCALLLLLIGEGQGQTILPAPPPASFAPAGQPTAACAVGSPGTLSVPGNGQTSLTADTALVSTLLNNVASSAFHAQ